MAIQLARFQQALLHTCDGQRFFPGKSGLAGHPGFRVFEDSIEIEDLSRAAELFAFAKLRTVSKSNADRQRKTEAKDVLAQKPNYYSPRVSADRDAVKAAAGTYNRSTTPVLRNQTIGTSGGETQHTTSNTHTALTQLQPGIKAENIEFVMPKTSSNGQEHHDVARHDESSGSPEVLPDDLHDFRKDQARIQERKAKAEQKDKDIKSKMANIKPNQKENQDQVRECEGRLKDLKRMLNDDDNNLRGLAVEQQEVANDLKHFERQDKLLKYDLDLAAIKRKRSELERDEERIKKQKLVLADQNGDIEVFGHPQRGSSRASLGREQTSQASNKVAAYERSRTLASTTALFVLSLRGQDEV